MAAVTLQPKTYKQSVNTTENALPQSFANFPWKYVVYPGAWEFNPAHGFLPVPCEIVAKPGVNGVDLQLQTNKADAGAIKKGGIIIQPNDRRLGEWVDYVEMYPVTGKNNWHFCFKGTEIELLPGGRAAAKDNSANLQRFQKHIRDAGVVEPMSETTYRGLLERARLKLDRLIKRARQTDAVKEDVEAQRAFIKAMEAAWASPAASVGVAPADTAGAPVKLKPKSATATLQAAASGAPAADPS